MQHNLAMPQTLLRPTMQQTQAADAIATAPVAIRTPSSAQRLRHARPARKFGRRRPNVSGYRFLMLVVFAGIVMVDSWFDQHLSSVVNADVVGPVSIVVWILILLGSFDLGPFAEIKKAMR
ncbi:hypothetical protein ACGLHS_06965 [Variovorax sp. VaC1]|uniref:hypothetical protein n=1 Tax=Variovorax sp. VaC1 TaxID=3373132 RepID=UPI00374A4787